MGSKTFSSLSFPVPTASSLFILSGPGDIRGYGAWARSADSSLLFSLLFSIEEILLCVGGEHSIPISTSFPSGKSKKAAPTGSSAGAPR